MALPKTEAFSGPSGQHLVDRPGWVYYRDLGIGHDNVRLNAAGNAIIDIANAVDFHGWEGDGAFNANQYAQIKCTNAVSNGYVGAIVRGAKTDDTHSTCYGFFGASNDGFYLFYYNNDNTEHDLVHYTDANLQTGDVLRIEISGSNIVCKLNGNSIITTSDSTISAAGHAGICIYGNTATELDDFEGGNLEDACETVVIMEINTVVTTITTVKVN